MGWMVGMKGSNGWMDETGWLDRREETGGWEDDWDSG